jgi:hypothetical protein
MCHDHVVLRCSFVLLVCACDAGQAPDEHPVPDGHRGHEAALADAASRNRMVASAAARGPTPAADPKPVADPKALEAAAKLLARAYGTERATLGPLFGAMKIGRISSPKWRDPIELAGVPVSQFMLMGADEKPLPVDAELKIRLSTASGPPEKNAPSYYFDGADIMVRNAELCTQLGQRLEKLWGPQNAWNNPARHQAARLDLTSAPGVSCTLEVFRTATTDAAHCLPDEETVDSREIDIRRGCLKANRPTTCKLVRYSDAPFEVADCQADDAHHRFYAGDVPRSVARPRSCTLEELHSLHFSGLPDCDKPCPACSELRRAGIIR